MNLNVINHNLEVTNIKILGIASSAVFLIGDTEYITCSSVFDTPPESLIIGPFVPLT